MEFDKSRVYTALNADELKVGSKVYLHNNLAGLKELVINEHKRFVRKIKTIRSANEEYRFCDEDNCIGPLVYLISEPEEKKLKWTDLKRGDSIKQKGGTISYLVTGIDTSLLTHNHVFARGVWVSDKELAEWEKVEE